MAKRIVRSCFICLVAAVVALIFYSYWRSPVDPGATESVDFTIASGAGLDRIGQELYQASLVHSVAVFKIQVLISGVSKKIQAGDFSLSPAMNLVEIVSQLTHARTDRRVTLLEGWRREEMAAVIEMVMSQNNSDYRFDPQSFVSQSASVEGRLFPNTYFFPKNITSDAAIEILTQTFRQQTAELSNQSGLTDTDALILASLVEREARNEAERPVVAGILQKRLMAGWPLQVDATVQYLVASRSCRQYACDWWPRPLTSQDIGQDSPYNTYHRTGLPPSPIANPSLVSIRSAFSPKNSEYWFYLHDDSGKIHYATTIEEHNQNIARYLQ